MCSGECFLGKAGVLDLERCYARTASSEKKGASLVKISAASHIGNSGVRVPDVQASVETGESRSSGIAMLRLLNSEVLPFRRSVAMYEAAMCTIGMRASPGCDPPFDEVSASDA